LIRPAVAVGVFANADFVAALADRLQLVRIVVGLANPKTAALVPGHVDRLALKLWFGDEQFDLEAYGRDKMLHRFFDGEWLLHLAPLAIAAARRAWRIEGYFSLNVF